MADVWRNLNPRAAGGVHYSVLTLACPSDGMASLRAMFPEAKADEMNAVLFSTSGVHGTYNTIEDAERHLRGETLDGEGYSEVTFVILHPRMVAVRYGNCDPQDQDDIDFLKQLRASSHAALLTIGGDHG
jgi:hypothetical protein